MITSISKTEQLKSLILKDIRGEVYRPGDSLPSIRDLCFRYGVSKHTVSQALSNLNELGIIELIHGKITRIAANPFSKHIEIIYVSNIPIEQQEFWSEFYRGIVDEFRLNPEFRFAIRSIIESGKFEPMENINVANTAGALVLGSVNEQMLNYLFRYRIPFIMVYDRVDKAEVSFISSEFREAISRVIELFKLRGCHRLAYIGSFCKYANGGINTAKMKYFRDALTSAGLPIVESLFREAEHKTPCGYEAMKALLADGQRPDGLFVASDVLAVGAYRAMHEFGIVPGKDLAVAGCDNLEIGKFLIPSLTTIELFRYRQGRMAARRMVELINDKVAPGFQETLPTEIVIRESLN